MSGPRALGPQQTLLYRTVAFFSRLQLRHLLRSVGNPRTLVVLFVFLEGAAALAIITLAAYLTQLPLLFPPLGPSAFILFHTPMSPRASPRNIILSHALGLLAGIVSLGWVGFLYPGVMLGAPGVMSWPHVVAVASAMGLISIAMIVLDCAHPPAAATALLGAMGLFRNGAQMLGLLGAVILLVAEAFVLNRLAGGLPYPLWRADPEVVRRYGALAGVPETGTSYWQRLTAQVLHQARR